MLQMAQRKKMGNPNLSAKSQRVQPTPETATKLRPYHVTTLPQDLQEAAGAIEIAWRLITMGLSCKGSSPMRVSSGKRKDYSNPQLLLIARYKRWADELPRRRLDLDHVITLVIDGMEPRELDWRTHHDAGWAAERLIEALALYNRMADEISMESVSG